ncbi:MAG: ComEC/Rec2 family competence protein [Aliishimia sp.]
MQHAVMSSIEWLLARLEAQRGALLPWAPVCLGVGICLYFTQSTEPSAYVLWALAGLSLGAAALSVRFSWSVLSLLGWALALTAAGVALAGWRAHDVAAPVLKWRYYGPIEGRVVGLDRSASDAVRVTLDRVVLARMSPGRTPARVRISLHGDAVDGPEPIPGARLMTTGHLSPPSGPVEPGGFDFQRHSWFKQLGAVGYIRVPLMPVAHPKSDSWSLWVFQTRMAVSDFVRAALPGDVGGFAAAVTSGDRSGMSQAALGNLRASNLAHLLAISGLHMGLLTGVVFAALRFGLVLVPHIALYWPVRRIAAIGALIAASGYLALSGGNVATERAYIMAVVALVAVMLNRRAFSLRAVAMAALVVLFLRPEALLGPGFQMSFAATTALVAIFTAMRDLPWKLPKPLQGAAGVVISSAIAGFATAPFAAAHFNAIAQYGLIANLVSVPVMGIIVVPAAVVATVLAPFGFAHVGLEVMGLGLRWILWVAELTAGLPGARSFVVSPNSWVLPCLTLGALFVILWNGRERWIGVLPIVAAFALWMTSERPDLLIADTGGLVGVMTPEGRALSRDRGAGFVAQNWLENDGDAAGQEASNARWESAWPGEVPHPGRASLGSFAAGAVWHLTGKKSAANLPDCSDGIIVSNQVLEASLVGCRVFDPKTLKTTGAVAVRLRADGTWQTKTARQVAGDRLWSGWPEEKRGRRNQ